MSVTVYCGSAGAKDLVDLPRQLCRVVPVSSVGDMWWRLCVHVYFANDSAAGLMNGFGVHVRTYEPPVPAENQHPNPIA